MTTNIHITALDGIVNVNSLFTLAVFVGLALNPRDPANVLIENPACYPGPSVGVDLVAFHVYSFSSFLFSSIVALGVKQAIRLSHSTPSSFHAHPALDILAHHVNKTVLRVGMLVAGAGSVGGCLFLMLALINVAQVKLGSLACGSGYTYAAVVPLVILVPAALLIHALLG